jgi:hypothetical protein
LLIGQAVNGDRSRHERDAEGWTRRHAMGGHEGEFVFSTSPMFPAQGYAQLLMELEKCLGRLTGIRDK